MLLFSTHMSYEFTGGYKIRDQAATHFMTFTVVGWVDVFSRVRYRDLIIESFRFCQEYKGLRIHGYVIMTNHIHVIWTAKEANLSDIVRDFKSHTSKAIVDLIYVEGESRRDWLLHMFRFHARRTNANKYFKVWTGDNHPEEIYTRPFFQQKLHYIHMNPVKAGWVNEPSEYISSSATQYEGKAGQIEIDFLY